MKPPARKLVQCTNDECPEVAASGQPWKGQRKNSRATEEPCPRCSSAVVVVAGDARLEAVGALVEPEAASVEEAEKPSGLLVAAGVRPPLREPFSGRPTVTCHEPVRYGLAAHQRIEALARSREHRGRSRSEIIGWVLDRWGAGIGETPGAA